MPPLWPRMRTNATGASRELRLFFREVDSEVLAPRVAALVFLLGGLLALAVTFVAPDFHGTARQQRTGIALGVDDLDHPLERDKREDDEDRQSHVPTMRNTAEKPGPSAVIMIFLRRQSIRSNTNSAVTADMLP